MDNRIKVILYVLLVTVFICLLVSYINSIQHKNKIIQLNENKMFVTEEPENHFKNKKVIITGLVRNSETTLPNSILFLYGQIVPHFKDYKILVYESDSADKSRDVLLKHSAIDNKFKIMCGNRPDENLKKCELHMAETKYRTTSSDRINKMSFFRNMYINEIKKDIYNDYDFVIVYDFDLNPTINIDGIKSSSMYFNKYKNIDAICANGVDRSTNNYYDIYAYEALGKHHKYNSENKRKYLKRNSNTGLGKVNSCFGGLTIYRRTPFIKSSYYTYKKNETDKGVVCEHVGLNNNLNIYTNYDMILLLDNAYSEQFHSIDPYSHEKYFHIIYNDPYENPY